MIELVKMGKTIIIETNYTFIVIKMSEGKSY